MRTAEIDLDDAEGLLAADVHGLLRGGALTGATIRSVAEAVREGTLAPLEQLRPRAVVVICDDDRFTSALELAIATVGAHSDVPVTTSPVLPPWIGPLDVVVVLGADPSSWRLADAISRARRRRAEVIVAAPLAGAVADASAGDVIAFGPRLDLAPAFLWGWAVATVVAVLGALTQVRGPRVDLDAIAAAVDEEAASDRPSAESFHNPAKVLALRLADHEVITSGDTPATAALARHLAGYCAGVAGLTSAAVDFGDAAHYARAERQVDIFHDPLIDGPVEAARRVLLLTVPSRLWLASQRSAGVAGSETVVSTDEAPAAAAGSVATDEASDLTDLLVVAVRLQLAAAYVSIAGG